MNTRSHVAPQFWSRSRIIATCAVWHQVLQTYDLVVIYFSFQPGNNTVQDHQVHLRAFYRNYEQPLHADFHVPGPATDSNVIRCAVQDALKRFEENSHDPSLKTR